VRRKKWDFIQIYKIRNSAEELDIILRANTRSGIPGRRHRHQITREVLRNVAMRNNFLAKQKAAPPDIVDAGDVTSIKHIS